MDTWFPIGLLTVVMFAGVFCFVWMITPVPDIWECSNHDPTHRIELSWSQGDKHRFKHMVSYVNRYGCQGWTLAVEE